MNRLKLWLYVLLLLGAGVANLYFLTSWVSARSVAQVDRDLRTGAALADARVRLLGATASDLADAAARAPTVVAALADQAADALPAVVEGVQGAARARAADPANLLIGSAGAHGMGARLGDAALPVPEPLIALLSEAQAGTRREAWVQLDGALWLVTAVPAGRGGAVAAGLPLDARFLANLRGAAGVDVTLVLDDGRVAASTLQGGAVAQVTGAAKAPRRPVDSGKLGRIEANLDWPLPPMPVLFADPPENRAMAAPLDGAGAALVLSMGTATLFNGLVGYQVIAFAALALLLLAGLVLGLLMNEGQPSAARARAAAPERPSRAVPAPVSMAQRLAPPPEPRPAAALEPDAAPAVAPERAVAAAPAPVAVPAPAAAVEPEPRPFAPHEPEAAEADAAVTAPLFPALDRAPVEEAPYEPEALAAPEPAPAIEHDEDAALAAFEDEPLPEEQDDDAHWREVYADFLRLRANNGEPVEGVTYERFKVKLERHRDQVIARERCRTVRFTAYLKEGKAALRANPVA